MLPSSTKGSSCLLPFVGSPGLGASAGRDGNRFFRFNASLRAENKASALHATEIVRRDYLVKEKEQYDLAVRPPTYTFSPALSACAPIAASNLVGFYGRYEQDLIPNHSCGTLLDNGYIYSIQDEAIAALTRQLYDYMGTDETGTTEAEFLCGLRTYCRARGRCVSIFSCMSSGVFDFSKAKMYIESNLPIVFFVSGYNIGYMSEKKHRDSVGYIISPANHVMVGFGYSVHSYVTARGSAADYYFTVASGIESNPSGIYNINYKTTIIDALAVNIY